MLDKYIWLLLQLTPLGVGDEIQLTNANGAANRLGRLYDRYKP
jgi:UTP-glucose-1-phosphate uridylyltransferase